MRALLSAVLLPLWLVLGASMALAQGFDDPPVENEGSPMEDVVSPVENADPPVQNAVPYTPPTVYAPPRTFQHTQPRQDSVGSEAWVTVGGWGKWDRGRGRRGLEVAVPVPLDAPRPQSQAALTQQILGEFSECLANGTDQILDCLRQNHNSVTIRKLQACLRSDVIPPDPAEVQACLAQGQW